MGIYNGMIKKDKDRVYFINYPDDILNDIYYQNIEECGTYNRYK